MIFQSRAATEYDMVIGPKDLNSDNVWSLTTPSLEKCFAADDVLPSPGLFPSPDMDMSPALALDSSKTGKLDWHAFASSIAEGHYHRLTTSQCEEFLNKINTVGTKSIVALTSNLSVSDGGNKAILTTGFSGGQPDRTSGLPIIDQHLKGDVFEEQSIVLSVTGRDGLLYYTYDNYTRSSCLGDGADNAACSDIDDMLKWTVSEEKLSLDGVKKHLKHKKIQEVHVEGYDTLCQTSLGGSGSSHLIDGCLAIEADEQCQLLYSPPICIVIMLTGLVKVLAMILAARIGRSRSPPLLTVGDAVASFMTKPDGTTEGMCWMSSANVRGGMWKKLPHGRQPRADEAESIPEEKTITFQRLSPRKFWIHAASVRRWVTTIVMFVTLTPLACEVTLTDPSSSLACIAAGSYLLEQAITTNSGAAMYDHSPWLRTSLLREWWKGGLLTENYSEIDLKSTELTMLGSIVVANTPQLAITLSYYGFNSVLTSMLAASEYNSYGTSSKPLRVTWPVKGSKQQSNYWLSVPYQYAVPILVIYTVLHWLISQSIFYVMLIPFRPNGQPDSLFRVSELGYSPLPIFLSILVGGLMVCILLGLSSRRLKSHMPLAGTCSVAISAACHPPRNESLDSASLGQLTWGETIAAPTWAVDHLGGLEGQKGHCSFTALDTVEPSTEKLYA